MRFSELPEDERRAAVARRSAEYACYVALGTLAANLAVAGALCAAFVLGKHECCGETMGLGRCWYPGCGRSAL